MIGQSPRRGALVDCAHAAEGELAETAFNEQARFAIKHLIALSAGVGLEAVFKNEAHLQTVAEVLDAL